MEPTYYDGDLVVMRRTHDYTKGDIVAYSVPKGEPGAGAMVIHRIVGGDSKGFITRGDNGNGNDPWRPTDSEIAGEQILHVSAAGRILAQLRAPLVVAILAAAFTVYFVLTSGNSRNKPVIDPVVRPSESSSALRVVWTRMRSSRDGIPDPGPAGDIRGGSALGIVADASSPRPDFGLFSNPSTPTSHKLTVGTLTLAFYVLCALIKLRKPSGALR
jgi:signal peptidase I